MANKVKGESAIMMTLAATGGVFAGHLTKALHLDGLFLTIPTSFLIGILIGYIIFFIILPKLEHATKSSSTCNH